MGNEKMLRNQKLKTKNLPPTEAGTFAYKQTIGTKFKA
jgi:hypothetical protein